MREIKFRSFSKSWNCMRTSKDDYWTGIEIPSGKVIFNEAGKIVDAPEDIIIMQYTGLKDKNGKEIYEGDILEWKHETGYNTFDIEKEEVKWEKDGCWNISCNFAMQDYSNECEIIGNIYENPELINK